MKGKELAKRVTELLDDKKGENIVCFNIGGSSSLADYFIIATGNVDTHVKALAENMSVELKKQGVAPLAHEGTGSGSWVCVDYGDVIVHVMRQAERNFYNLEAIWGGCPKEVF
ncbi:MAG: ribosome silencing factor [Deferribacterales bacterium]|nr:ribosome silencing factor [Deferribacterales bacterium]